jgi:hypothetical protein
MAVREDENGKLDRRTLVVLQSFWELQAKTAPTSLPRSGELSRQS